MNNARLVPNYRMIPAVIKIYEQIHWLSIKDWATREEGGWGKRVVLVEHNLHKMMTTMTVFRLIVNQFK